MRRVIAIVIIGLMTAIALTALQSKKTNPTTTEGAQPMNYFQQFQDCGATCLPVAVILMVVAD